MLLRLRDANWIRRRTKKVLDYNYSSSPQIRYLTAIIGEDGNFKTVSMCRFPNKEDYKTFLSYNTSHVITGNLGYRWANDNMSAWSPNNNYSNYNNYNNWLQSLGSLYNSHIDSF